MDSDNIILIILFATANLVLFYFLNKKQQKNIQKEIATIDQSIISRIPELLKSTNENLIMLADQKLGAEKTEIRTDLHNKRYEIERMVKLIQEELKENQRKLEHYDKERIGSFNTLAEAIKTQSDLSAKLQVTTENLNKVLSNNQLRGQFGEQVAEDLLRMSGFIKGVDYEVQESLGHADTRPDFCIYLPDGTKINVDSKFPYSNLQRMVDTDQKESKEALFKAFEKDVKEKIKQMSNRDYINSADKTVDFVILFIPNEMIFSFIYDKLPDLWVEALEKKVILAGPFSFSAVLRMVRQAYENFRYQGNIKEIISHIQAFEKEFDLFNLEFEKVGEKIDSLEKQYTKVSTTRTNQLIRRIDKVKQINNVDENEESQKRLI